MLTPWIYSYLVLGLWPQLPAQVGGSDVQQPDRSPGLTERIEWIVAEARDTLGMECLAIHAQVGDDVVFEGGFGAADGAAVNAQTTFAAGPAAGVLLTVAVLRAARAGEVDLDTELTALLPDHGIPWKDTTLHGLLAHTAGLPILPPSLATDASAPRAKSDEGDGDDAAQSEPQPTRESWLAWLLAAPLAAEPDSCLNFANSNLLLSELWLEHATGRGFEAYLGSDLLPALGLAADRIAGAQPEGWVPMSVEVGAASVETQHAPATLAGARLWLSAADLVHLARAIENRALVVDEDAQRILGDTRLASGELTGRGYGMHRTWLDKTAGVAFGGAVMPGAGEGSVVRVASYPSMGLTIAVVGRGRAESLAGVERKLSRAMFDLPQPELSDLPLAAEEIAPLLGDYKVGCNSLTILEVAGRIHLRTATTQHAFAYQGGGRFATWDGAEIELEFTLDEDGSASRFLLRRDGTQVIARRMF